MKILDCTLRDGGYYNCWDFDYYQAKKLILALNEAGIDIVEVGYKSPSSNGFNGLFKYCKESMLQYLKEHTSAEYAFMIDVKEFLGAEGINADLLESMIQPAGESVFSWVRLASHYATLEYIPGFIEYFQNRGYKVCFNLMGGSLLTEGEMLSAINQVNPNPPEVFYIADSFGSFYPDDIKRLINLVKRNFNGKVGIHTHDNQGMAFSNTLAAIEAGVDFVDGTVTGMGRGAGNLVLEQFLVKYAEISQNPKYKPNALLDVINSYIQPLKEVYHWGFNYVYMLSGLKNIHPSYCQKLSEGNRYTKSQISSILEQIPEGNRAKYNEKVLEEAIKRELSCRSTSPGNVNLPAISYSNFPVVLIIAKGESVEKHQEALNILSKEKDALIIDCNNTKYLQETSQKRLVAIINEVRLNHFLEENSNPKVKVVTGQCTIPVGNEYNNVFFQDFKLGEFLVNDTISIPDYDTGLFALALAVKHSAREIFMAGFDGFRDEQKNYQFDNYFLQVNKYLEERNIKLVSVTATKYNNISKSSVYSLLK